MADLERIYGRLPVPLQHLACSVEGWRIEHRRLAGAFDDLLRAAEARSFVSEDEIVAYRDGRVRAFVDHAFTSPYHARRFRDIGLERGDVRSLDDLRNVPVLTKREVQEHYEELVSRAVPERLHRPIHTSGTTGGGLRFATTLTAVREQWATWWRYWHWHGIRRGTSCGYFGGRSIVPLSQTKPPFWRYNAPQRRILFSAYHINERNLPAYVAELRRKRPPWLHGYPSVLTLVANHIAESGSDLGYAVRWITTGAENLLPRQSAAIEAAFGVRPKQHYGMAEAVANFSECDRGALHVDEDFAAVEFVPQAGGMFSIVGTNFTNPVTPLLRYEVQDAATLDGDTCSCGRPGRVVASVDGRLEDYVILRNGARVGRMDHIFKDLVRIREAQIRQSVPGELTIRVVRAAEYSDADERELLRETRKRVGDDTTVRIEYVPALERSETGKLRFVVSDLAAGSVGGG